MKKILIASTALTMLAGAASADVTLGGLGYFGLTYDKHAGDLAIPEQKVQLLDRLQFEIKGSKTTDSGLTFHGKVRMRSQRDVSHGNTTTAVNGGQVGVTAGGLDVTVGNVSDAIDALSLYWDSEIGLCGCGGETLTVPFVGYTSYGGGANGVLATYTAGSLVVRGSVMSNDHFKGTKPEAAISVAYKVGALSMEAGYVQQSASATQTKYNGATLVVEYALGSSNIGLAAGHNGGDVAGAANKTIVTLYGNTKFGATTVAAFASQAGGMAAGETTKTTYGIGASYDLGSGAALVGHVRTDRTKDTLADLGVKFAF
jgi:outer membrane protein OmpU